MKFNSITLFIVALTMINCRNHKANTVSQNKNLITCTEFECSGTYVGPEFIDGSDIAHQFSNHMSKAVGDQLKALYRNSKWAQVDFDNIKMTTEGMGSGQVVYSLIIPYERVESKCDAYTSFDHVGGWNHAPELDQRKKQLKSALLPNEYLKISPLLKTKEGLQEYWIQWRNKVVQKECVLASRSEL